MAQTLSKCASCGYPLTAEYPGQQTTCPMCNTVNEAISGVTIATPVFVGIVCFFGGLLIGPSIIASTEGGKKWLERTVRAKIK